jgi:AcrR family transcriptional regulator
MPASVKKRRKRQAYSSPLRQQQQEMTRTRIMEACMRLIAEGRLANFSIRDVAERAEVSYASVYRHFASRDEIINALYAWGDEQMARRGGTPPRTLADLADSTRRKLAAWEEQFSLVTAVALALSAQGVQLENRRQRDVLTRTMLADAAPGLGAQRVRELSAMISHVTSVLTWTTLRTRFGLNAEEAANSILSSLDLLIDAATASRTR